MAKTAVSELLDSPKLISRKILKFPHCENLFCPIFSIFSFFSAMHTLWVRQHNKLAEQLSQLNPHWNDEQIFQETRRIVGAQIQHITYSEFLPVILGKEAMDRFNLDPQKMGFFSG